MGDHWLFGEKCFVTSQQMINHEDGRSTRCCTKASFFGSLQSLIDCHGLEAKVRSTFFKFDSHMVVNQRAFADRSSSFMAILLQPKQSQVCSPATSSGHSLTVQVVQIHFFLAAGGSQTVCVARVQIVDPKITNKLKYYFGIGQSDRCYQPIERKASGLL